MDFSSGCGTWKGRLVAIFFSWNFENLRPSSRRDATRHDATVTFQALPLVSVVPFFGINHSFYKLASQVEARPTRNIKLYPRENLARTSLVNVSLFRLSTSLSPFFLPNFFLKVSTYSVCTIFLIRC